MAAIGSLAQMENGGACCTSSLMARLDAWCVSLLYQAHGRSWWTWQKAATWRTLGNTKPTTFMNKCPKCGHEWADKGRTKGGKARWKGTTKKTRSAAASKAAKARWQKSENTQLTDTVL